MTPAYPVRETKPMFPTEHVRGLALTCLENPNVLPILADALEEAGKPDLAGQARDGCMPAATLQSLTITPAQYAAAESAKLATAKRQAKESREKKYADARRGIAIALAQRWHATVADLYASKRAEVVYGSGGGEVVDWDAYKGKYRPNGRPVPAKYRNAGVRVIGFGRSGRIVIENSRGTEVARLPLPPAGAVVFTGSGAAGGRGNAPALIR